MSLSRKRGREEERGRGGGGEKGREGERERESLYRKWPLPLFLPFYLERQNKGKMQMELQQTSCNHKVKTRDGKVNISKNGKRKDAKSLGPE